MFYKFFFTLKRIITINIIIIEIERERERID